MFFAEVISQIGEDISILLKLDNHSPNYICECGDASRLTVRDSQNAAAIFISHTHIDHFVNFDTILRHQLGNERRVVICGPAGIARQVQAKIMAYTWNLVQEGALSYEIREIVSGSEIQVYELTPPKWELRSLGAMDSTAVFENARFQVQFTLLDHKIPTVAYLFKENDSVKIDLSRTDFRGGSWVKALKTAYEQQDREADIEIEGNSYPAAELFELLAVKPGPTLGVIMDHAATSDNHAKIKALFSGCDQVLIECFYKAEDREFAEANSHSYSTASGEIMRACGVKNAIPVHFSRKYDAAEVAQLVAEFEAAYSGN